MIEEYWFVESSDKEWDYMWLNLSEDEINKDNTDPFSCYNYGECWQYMDTANYDGIIKHCFRHRAHPKMHDTRTYLKIEASKEYIEKIFIDIKNK